MMMIETQDQAYEFFVQESTELLHILEQGLMNLSQIHDMQKLHELMRAAHSIKGGAACVGLMGIQHIAHDLENGIRALYAEETVFDLALEELLLQAFDCLRSPIVEQIETGFHNEEAAIARSLPIFEQLEAKLGHPLEEAAELPEMPMEGDMTAFLFAEEVPSGLRRWENVLKAADESKIRTELKTQAEVFSTLGSMLGLSGFSAIAEAVLAALETHPQACRQIGQIALTDLWAGQDAVLEGDRTQGGQPSQTLIQWTKPIEVQTPTPAQVSPETEADDPKDLFILPPLQETLTPDALPLELDASEFSLSELLLQGLECLRLPLLEQIETGRWQAETTIDQVQAMVQQLEAKLGHSLPDIAQPLEINPKIIADLQSQQETDADTELRAEFKTQMEIFVTLGQMLNQPQLSALASASLNALETNPQATVTMSLLAFAGIYAQQKAKWKEQGISIPALTVPTTAVTSTEKELDPAAVQDDTQELSSLVLNGSEDLSSSDQGLDSPANSDLIFDIIETELNFTYQTDEVINQNEINSDISDLASEPIAEDEINSDISDLASEPIAEDEINSDISDLEPEEISENEINSNISYLESEEISENEINSNISDLESEEISENEINSNISDLEPEEISENEINSNISDLEPEEIDEIELETQPQNPGILMNGNGMKPVPSAVNIANEIAITHDVNLESQTPLPTVLSSGRTQIQPQLSLGVRVDVNRLDQLNNLVGELATQDNSLLLENQKAQDSIDLLENSRERFRKLSVEIQGHTRFLAQQKSSSSRTKLESSALSKAVQETLEELDKIRSSIYDMKLINLQSQQNINKRQQTLQKVQKNLTETRMIPVESLLNRFPRMVRDLSVRTQKSVKLELSGEKTLIDKAILEKLYDPLVHLVRNAFDHGVEPAEYRFSQGKIKEGKIEIKAYHQGNYTYLEVQDNGQGIDLDRIRSQAIKKQIISVQDAARLSQKQLYELLFYPGFSTTEKVSELSGRGVGLEAVRRQIEALKGNITIQSELGKGTNFTLRLPWTITMTKLLVFRVEQSLFSIPMDALAGIVSVSAAEIKTDDTAKAPLGEQQKKIYDWYGQNVPLVQSLLLEYHHPSASVLTRYQRTEKDNASPPQQSSGQVMLLLISQGLETIALKIDQILMEQNLTIKPFNKILAAPPFCYGCTILGDGRLIPVVDSPELLEHWRQQQQSHFTGLTLESDQPKLAPDPSPTILVIDDSLTTRASLSSTLQKAGYEVLQAKQGREGLTQLQRYSQIQVVICDLEMPEMNGFEFLTHCRREYSQQELPVMILTSRNNDRHRQLAKQLGSNEYMTKPWTEQELMQILQQLQAKSMVVSGVH